MHPADRHAVLADPTRRALLDALREADAPLGVRALADRLALHPNSVREQLRRLEEAGLVRASTAAPSGRGRPGLRFETVPEPEDPYRVLAGVLADEVAELPDAPALWAAAGQRWGRAAATAARDAVPAGVPPDPLATVAALLADAGFALGDVVRVEPGGASITIVGVARDINYSVAPVLFVDFATFEAAKRTRNPDAAAILPSAIAIEVAAGSTPAQVAARINDQVDGVEALTRQEAVDGSPGVSSVRTSFAIILGLFYLVVPLVTGLFFLIVTFQKASALTLLRAIGAPARTLVWSLLVQVFIVMTIGSVIAFGLYAGAIQGVSNLGIHVEVMPAVITSVVVLALALLTSLVAVRRVLRLDPLSATTGAGIAL